MLLFLFAEASPIFELFAEQGRSMLRPCGRRIPRDSLAFLALYWRSQ